MSTGTCERCGASFEIPKFCPRKKEWCGPRCREENYRESRTCIGCGARLSPGTTKRQCAECNSALGETDKPDVIGQRRFHRVWVDGRSEIVVEKVVRKKRGARKPVERGAVG